MTCPRCDSYQVKVTDSRPADNMVRRRRKCMDCNFRFMTIEIDHAEYERLRRFYEKNR